MAEESRNTQRGKRVGKGGDPLGKLIERFAPTMKRVTLFMGAIIAVLLAVIAVGYALLVADSGTRPLAFGASGLFALVVLVCLLLLQFGVAGSSFEVHKYGVRYKTGRSVTHLFWEEISDISIDRIVRAPGSRGGTMMYEIYLDGSETIHLANTFLSSLADPTELIRCLKRYSGKDFQTVVG